MLLSSKYFSHIQRPGQGLEKQAPNSTQPEFRQRYKPKAIKGEFLSSSYSGHQDKINYLGIWDKMLANNATSRR